MGVGGSEVHNLWSLEPYGCRRRLWYQKTKSPADFPATPSRDMERGSHLEAIVARIYREATGRKVSPAGFWRDPEQPHLIVHPDRLLDPLPGGPRAGRGILEIKCPGVRQFLKVKREGLPEGWILQVQHGLSVTGFSWGSFAVFSAELWELLHLDMERDPVLIERLRAEGTRFWASVENGPPPDRLPPDDHRCQTCPFRTTCQGQALLQRVLPYAEGPELPRDDALLPAVEEYLQARKMEEEVEVLVAAARHRLEAALGDRQRLVAGNCKVYWQARTEKRLDVAALRARHPELAREFEVDSVVRPLRVYGGQ
jgi:predicted phage-related endonuclease